jgi:Tfp pilus assembly protein PilV
MLNKETTHLTSLENRGTIGNKKAMSIIEVMIAIFIFTM